MAALDLDWKKLRAFKWGRPGFESMYRILDQWKMRPIVSYIGGRHRLLSMYAEVGPVHINVYLYIDHMIARIRGRDLEYHRFARRLSGFKSIKQPKWRRFMIESVREVVGQNIERIVLSVDSS